MGDSETIRVGVLGAAGRASDFAPAIADSGRASAVAVCDLSPERVEAAAETYGAAETYLDYDAMLWEADLDAVVVGTPKQYHVAQCVAALERDLHVLCEVPAAASLGECRDLVRAAERSAGTYGMAENFVYREDVSLVRELVREGLFGDVYHVAGERVGEEVAKLERTKWRRTWRAGRNGVTYPTHTLGPVLSWLPGDRIERVACAGGGHRHADPRGDAYEQEDAVVLLGETEAGRLVRLRQDLFSKRPPEKYRFELQGTAGCYESGRRPGEDDAVWLESLHGDDREWHSLGDVPASYRPERWRDAPDRVRNLGHGGADYFVVADFLDAVAAGDPAPIGVHRAMDMTLPGILSGRAVESGEWVAVPDSRAW